MRGNGNSADAVTNGLPDDLLPPVVCWKWKKQYDGASFKYITGQSQVSIAALIYGVLPTYSSKISLMKISLPRAALVQGHVYAFCIQTMHHVDYFVCGMLGSVLGGGSGGTASGPIRSFMECSPLPRSQHVRTSMEISYFIGK